MKNLLNISPEQKMILDKQIKEVLESQNKKRVWFVLDPEEKLAIIISTEARKAFGNPSMPAIFFREIDALNCKNRLETEIQGKKFEVKEIYY